MGDSTLIAWSQRTWNPWRGCTKISPGCAHCYMFSAQERFGRDPAVVVRTGTWGQPLKWERQAAAAGRLERVFTCSWSDWFHADADDWRDEAWAVIKRCPHLQFQILTKRQERIVAHLPADWGDADAARRYAQQYAYWGPPYWGPAFWGYGSCWPYRRAARFGCW